jgi:hypothetical protein
MPENGDTMPIRDPTEHRWTLGFYQAFSGVREVTVTDGPYLTSDSTIEVVPVAEADRLQEALDEACQRAFSDGPAAARAILADIDRKRAQRS